MKRVIALDEVENWNSLSLQHYASGVEVLHGELAQSKMFDENMKMS